MSILSQGCARRFLWLLLLVLPGVAPLWAQDTERVPVVAEAETVFEQAVQVFKDANYPLAYRRFREVTDGFPLHQKTTAAWLMAGKALYRQGAYQDAIDLLQQFVADYATSGYVNEAYEVIRYARDYLDETVPDPLQVGIILSLDRQDTPLTQELFNGIRIAIDGHNSNLQGRLPIRMVFRDTRNDPEQVADAVRELASEGVHVIVGTLYSEAAKAAAEAAEAARVVFLAPLATAEAVSEGRTYAFQTNPTITMRGRLMARFAINGLRLNRFGVVAEMEDQYISERMAEGFYEEANQRGADIAFYTLLQDENGWFRLADVLTADTLNQVDAVYLPITGGNAQTLIGAALSGLDRMGATPRVLGNAEWHNLPMRSKASAFTTTYTNDFNVDNANPAVERFNRQYQALAGKRPSRLGYVGYDVAGYVVGHLTSGDTRPLAEVFQTAPQYDGLGMRIEFNQGNVNQAMFYHRYREGRLELLR